MFSGQSLYLDWTFQLYNIAYSAIPILIIAVLDKDFEHGFLETHPLVYAATRGDTYFNPSIIARWLLAGLIDSALCFFISWYSYDVSSGGGSRSSGREGQDVGFAAQGLVVYTCVCMVVNVKLAFFVRSWTWLHTVSFALSIGVYWLATGIFNASSFFRIGGLDYYHVLSFVGLQPRFWLTLLLCIGSSALLNLLYLAWVDLFFPASPLAVYYEAARLGYDVEECDKEYARAVQAKGFTNNNKQGNSSKGTRGGLQRTSSGMGDSKSGGVVRVRPVGIRSSKGGGFSPRLQLEGGEQGQGQEEVVSPAALSQVPILHSLPSPDASEGGLQHRNQHGYREAAFSPSALPFSPVPQLGASPSSAHDGANDVAAEHDPAQSPEVRIRLPNSTGSGAGSNSSGGNLSHRSQNKDSRIGGAESTTSPGHDHRVLSDKRLLTAQLPPQRAGTNALVRDAPTPTERGGGSAVSHSCPPAQQPHPNSAYSGFAFSHTPSARILNMQELASQQEESGNTPPEPPMPGSARRQ